MLSIRELEESVRRCKSENKNRLILGIYYEDYSHRLLEMGGVYSLRDLKGIDSVPFNIPKLKCKRFKNVRDFLNMRIDDNEYFIPESPVWPTWDSVARISGQLYYFQMIIRDGHPVKNAGLNYILKKHKSTERKPSLIFVVPEDVYDKFSPTFESRTNKVDYYVMKLYFP
jgi:hypothetical protein